MEERSIYKDIESRTKGDIYIGVVGPVRTGKSTFIKRFMDTLVIPNITDENIRMRATDELPQSAAGRTIMTTEPKFVPENAVRITLDDAAELKVRMIDCVGYIFDAAMGYMEGDAERMVKTPWSDKELPFKEAAELGTRKVISEHSTIAVLVTTDGTIGDIPREAYIPAEERVVRELKAGSRPFVILLNTTDPSSENAKSLSRSIAQKYNVPAIAVDCASLDEESIRAILASLLFEFPVREIRVHMPLWMQALGRDDPIRASVFGAVRERASHIGKMGEIESAVRDIAESDHIRDASLSVMDMGRGAAVIEVDLPRGMFYRVISDKTGLEIADDRALLENVCLLSEKQKKFDKIAGAYDEVMENGYGIVMPTLEELSLEEPEIVRQSGKYGIRLKASAPSIHMMRISTTAEVTPIVGSEQQSEELVDYLLKEFEEDPVRIWESNIFGKSVSDLVNEGLHNKLYRMPAQARRKVGETIEKIINDGCNGLICIIL